MSNASLNAHVDKFIALLSRLARGACESDQMRAAIGIVALHQFGYREFNVLSRIFDRLLPQVDLNCVRFTSWCAGQLIHHPEGEQSRYVMHLFERCVGWTNSKGRRARQLAAANLLCALATNAGSTVVVSIRLFQSIIWTLVTHQSTNVLQATASAIDAFTRAISRYGRGDLEMYYRFLTDMCFKLLEFGDPISEYAALLIFEGLINWFPSYFGTKMQVWYSHIVETVEDEPVLVQKQACVVFAALAQVDPALFVKMGMADDFLERATSVVLEFPEDIVKAIGFISKILPDFIEERLNDLKEMAKMLCGEAESAFDLLTHMVNSFGAKVLPIDQEVVSELLKETITTSYGRFVVAFAGIDGFTEEMKVLLSQRLEEHLKSDHPLVALRIVGRLPENVLRNHQPIYDAVWDLSTSEVVDIRKAVAKAAHNVAKISQTISVETTIQQLIDLAVYDHSLDVRASILEVLKDNVHPILVKSDCMAFLQALVNDDATSIRRLVYKLLSKLSKMNPIGVATITRRSLYDAFFIIKDVASIRLKSRVVRSLPELVEASARTMKAYSANFMDIVIHVIEQHSQNQKFENFLEEDAYNKFMMGIIDTIALLAPMDPGEVSKHAEVILPFYCNFLLTCSMRRLTLAILNLFFTLLSSPASTPHYRSQAPLILATCTSFLANTHSRKARMACLKVIGAIGVLDVHQRPPPKSTQAPENVDEALARQFFHPARDLESDSEEALPLSGENCEQYFTYVAADSLMKIFTDPTMKEFYVEVTHALVTILSRPKMQILSIFDRFVARLLTVLENSTIGEMKAFLQEYAHLIMNSTHNTAPFLERSLNLIINRFCDQLTIPFLDLIISFLTVLRDGFSRYASQAMCLLIGCLDSAKTTSIKICKRVLKAFSLMGLYASDLLYLIVPQICDVVVCEQTLPGVRVEALESLTDLVCAENLVPYLGPVMRALVVGFKDSDKKAQVTSMELLIVLMKAHGREFLQNAEPILSFVRSSGIESPEMEIVFKEIKEGKYDYHYEPIERPGKDRRPEPTPEKERTFQFSVEAVCSRAMTPNLGLGRHLEEWLRGLMLAVIANSPSPAIRACTSLATSHYPLAQKLFNPAFFSCWKAMEEKGAKDRQQIVDSFRELLMAKENYETVARDIINLLVYMNRIEHPLAIPTSDLVASCMRYGGTAFALHLQEEAMDAKLSDVNAISTLISIYVQLGDWDNAVGVWKQSQRVSSSLNKTEVLASLRMWDQVRGTYKTRFQRSKDFDSFVGLSKSLAAMALWPELMSYFDIFKDLQLHQKRVVSQSFAEAALHLGKWDVLDAILRNSPDDSTRCNALSALNALHRNKFNDVDAFVEKGFSLIASRPITFWAENQQIHRDTMLACQELVEILEMKQWVQGKNMREAEIVWNERLKTAPSDFELWFGIIANRGSIVPVQDENLIKFFQMKSVTLGTKIHTNAFDILFPAFHLANAPALHRVCWAVAKWNIGEKDVALGAMEQLTRTISDRQLADRCHFFVANWLMETDDSLSGLKKAFEHLKSVIEGEIKQVDSCDDVKTSKKLRKMCSGCASSLMLPPEVIQEMVGGSANVEVLRKWCDVNVALLSLDTANLPMYVNNAIDALTQCEKLSPSFPDVVQLLNLFFEYANREEVFNSTTRNCIETLSPKLMLQASPQLLVQLNHQTQEVAQFVHDIILQLLLDHYHELIFSVIVLTKSKNLSRAKAASNILEEFRQRRSKVYDEVYLVRKSLLIATVTWLEKVSGKLDDALYYFSRNSLDKIPSCLQTIVTLVNKHREYSCEMHESFKEKYQGQIDILEKQLQVFNPNVKSTVNQLHTWCQNMKNLIYPELNRIHRIQLSSISRELCQKTDFCLAVPGTYKPGHPPIRIKYFVGQLSVYETKQFPKDVVVKGEDGNFYQYLLKGHEDLRLDERVMQFFRVINFLLAREVFFRSHFIQTVTVIPLSVRNGLVQWVPGAATLRDIIGKVRTIHGRQELEEFSKLSEYGHYAVGNMLRIQKLQIFERICRELPDTDIANFFWIQAPSAETWLKQVNTFATSTAMTSIVGYVIGLGDRHPGNLMIDRFTGRIVHIDFGDCFEKAANRKEHPELVPFRLTRMIVKALGASGVHGLFMTSFINMSSLLRENQRVLIMVLAVFVQEPLIDPEPDDDDAPQESVSRATTGDVITTDSLLVPVADSVASSIALRRRVQQKLNGTDFEEGVQLSVDEQARRLISIASDPYTLSAMYMGWYPYW